MISFLNVSKYHIYDFKLLLKISFHLRASLIPTYLPSSIKLIFSASLLWLFIILMLSFSSLYFFSSSIIVVKSSCLVSLFIKALDILLSMLFNLLLASITILLCFFFFYFLLFWIVFFTILVEIDNPRLKLALTIATGAPITVENDAIEMLPVVTDKTINDLSK